jgi:hypothetical protein
MPNSTPPPTPWTQAPIDLTLPDAVNYVVDIEALDVVHSMVKAIFDNVKMRQMINDAVRAERQVLKAGIIRIFQQLTGNVVCCKCGRKRKRSMSDDSASTST